MTCKDCIHSGLCYKENDYENFPDRCGGFISDKVLEERPQGKWIISQTMNCRSDIIDIYTCPFCGEKEYCAYPFCHCGADMRGDVE